MLVGAVVIHDQMDVEILRDGLLDLAEEAQEFLVPVARLALGDHLASGHVQGSEQGGGAMADVVMGDALDVPQTHGQERLSPVEILNLRLLVNAEHHRLVGRIQVQADDVADLLVKEGICRQLEVLLPVRLDREGLQPAVNGGLGDASGSSVGTGTPLGTPIGGLGLQGPVDHLGHRVILMGTRPARSELDMQAFKAELSVTLAPLADGHPRQPHPFGDGGVGFTRTAGQHDLGALDDGVRQ